MPDYNQPVRVTIAGDAVGVESKTNSAAMLGVSAKWHGIYGESNSVVGGHGVKGYALGTGVVGESKTWYGVYGVSKGDGKKGAAAVYAFGDYTYGHGADAMGLYAKSRSWAGVFEGPVKLGGYVEAPGAMQVFPNSNSSISAYFAKPIRVAGGFRGTGGYGEIFDAEEEILPGAVVVIGDNGLLAPCSGECDTRVVGVVLGSENMPDNATTSDGESKHESERESSHQVTIAVAGQVSVLADPQHGEISPGDLLTTSPTAGCAMLVKDRARASGAIIGKALSSLNKETGLVRMLVMAT